MTTTNTLRFHRKAAGLRQLDVALALGIGSTDRISRWENGETLPHVPNLFMLSLLYKVPSEVLYAELISSLKEKMANRPLVEVIHLGNTSCRRCMNIPQPASSDATSRISHPAPSEPETSPLAKVPPSSDFDLLT